MHPFGDNSLRNVLSWIADERWSPDNQNTNATYPRLSRKTNANNTKLSTYWQRNGAFLKLKMQKSAILIKICVYTSVAPTC